MRRKPSAADDRSCSPAELIARVNADHAAATTTIARHRRVDVAAAETPGSPEPTTPRRLAPLAVGAAAMLVATAVASFVQPVTEVSGPDRSNSIAQEPPLDHLDKPSSTSSAPATIESSEASPPPTRKPPKPADPTRSTTKPPKPPKPTKPTKPTKPAEPPTKAPAPAPPVDDKQAAAKLGWTRTDGDEFNGGRSAKWGDYNGAGHGGNGTRSSDAISVENGALVIRGDSAGKSGGMAWQDSQRFGKWEMRARFPKGDKRYHPVLILWPTDVAWPQGGEIDFAETTSASNKVSFFLHYSASNKQKYAHKDIDLTQWHNYAVEWVDGRITGYIDGDQFFESTDRATMPPGKMHATIQLDYFPDGGSPQPTEMHVDYMRIYK